MMAIDMISHIPSITLLSKVLLDPHVLFISFSNHYLLTGDDDYHFRKAEAGKAMKSKLGLINPLDGASGSVRCELGKENCALTCFD